ncbi:acid phosphatase [Luteimonas sp. RIT-PG2_3]
MARPRVTAPRSRARLLALLPLIIAAAAMATEPVRPLSPGVEEISPGKLAGYLDNSALPDSVRLVVPAPAPGSVADQLDDDVSAARHLRGSSRWDQAIRDADVGFPQAAGLFSCALQANITADATPTLYRLLWRSRTDAAASVDAAKDRYQRPRPFMRNGDPTCTPDKQAGLAGNGSYPSGHAAIGWAWALILTELAPDRADAILARGRSFGESRLVCNVHWHSDVQAGQWMAAATVARLHGEPAFRADLDIARAELADLRASAPAAPAHCADEAAALEQPLPTQP